MSSNPMRLFYCRWLIHSDILQSLATMQAAVASGVPASVAAAAVKSTEVREFMVCTEVVLRTAAVISGLGAYLVPQAANDSHVGGRGGGSRGLTSFNGRAVAVSRFIDYGAAARELSAGLLQAVKQLLNFMNGSL